MLSILACVMTLLSASIEQWPTVWFDVCQVSTVQHIKSFVQNLENFGRIFSCRWLQSSCTSCCLYRSTDAVTQYLKSESATHLLESIWVHVGSRQFWAGFRCCTLCVYFNSPDIVKRSTLLVGSKGCRFVLIDFIKCSTSHRQTTAQLWRRTRGLSFVTPSSLNSFWFGFDWSQTTALGWSPMSRIALITFWRISNCKFFYFNCAKSCQSHFNYNLRDLCRIYISIGQINRWKELGPLYLSNYIHRQKFL